MHPKTWVWYCWQNTLTKMAVLRMAISLCPISVSGTQFVCWAFLLLPLIIIFQISKLNVMLVMPFVRKSYVTYIVQCNFFPLSTFIWKLSSGPLVVVLQYFVTKYHDFAKFLTCKRSCRRSITHTYTFLHWDVKSNHYKPANKVSFTALQRFLLLSPSTLKQF